MAIEVEKIKKGEKKLYKDFVDRWTLYSGLGWVNRKGLGKSSVGGQVPAFAIRLVSDSAILSLKKFPEIYEEIQKMSIIFQYIKYKPKEAARKSAAKFLAQKKYEARGENFARRAHGVKTLKLPTRDSLGITAQMEKFKQTYPKIQIRKSDGTRDVISNDWTGYLIGVVNYGFQDKQKIGEGFFFKYPAIMKATNKDDIEEKIFKKVKKILDRIEEIIAIFKNGSPDIYKSYKNEIIRLAKSLTIEGLDEEIKKKKEALQNAELNKKVLLHGNKDLGKTLSENQIDYDEISKNAQIQSKKEEKTTASKWQEI